MKLAFKQSDLSDEAWAECAKLLGGKSLAIERWHEFAKLWLSRIQDGAVYCFAVPTGAKKIGMTSGSWRTRMEALQTGNHEILTKIAVLEVPTGMAKQIEKALHTRFAEKRRQGEWFDITAADVVTAFREAETALLDAFIAMVGENAGFFAVGPANDQ